jgi:hypothetical protein
MSGIGRWNPVIQMAFRIHQVGLDGKKGYSFVHLELGVSHGLQRLNIEDEKTEPAAPAAEVEKRKLFP